MNTIESLFASLTVEQKATAIQGMHALRGLIQCRGKKATAEWEAKGFKMEKISAQYYCIDWEQSKALNEIATRHGKAVKVVSIDEKYNDNNGAYETMKIEDANGVQWEVGNMYDTKACFHRMSDEERLAYVNK